MRGVGVPGGLIRRAKAVRPEKLVQVALGALLLVGAAAAYSGAALTWDGASLLFAFLDIQELSLPHHRYTVALFQLPTLLLSRHVTDVRALELTFGLTYTIVPFLSAFVSFRLVRHVHPRLIVWHLLFIAVGALAGQLFFVTESLIALHLVWPLLLTVATGFTARRFALCAAIVALLFGLHPVAGALLLLTGAAGAALAMQNAARRKGLVVATVLLFAAGLARVWVSVNDPYEVSQAAVNFREIWRSLELPRVGVTAVCTLPALLLVAHHVRPSRAAPLYGVMAAMLVTVAMAFLPWARNLHAWRDELNFRFVAPFAAAPSLVGAAVVAVTTTPWGGRLSRGDGFIALAGTLVFSLVLVTQSLRWLSLRHSLESALGRSKGCVSMSSLPACRVTALRWWTTPSYALLLQGHAPRALLLDGNGCARQDLSRVIPVNPWYLRPRSVGWFDLTRTGLGR